MIKYVNLTAQVRNEKDFALLTRLLVALGLKHTEVEDYPQLLLQPFLPSGLTLEVVYRKKPHQHADLELVISDPDSAIEIVKKMGFQIVEDHSASEPRHVLQDFRVQLPGGTNVFVVGFRATGSTEPDYVGIEGNLSARGKRFAIVVSRFNSFITERLLAGAIDGLVRCGIASRKDREIVRVPGAFEVPLAARTLAKTRKYDAIVCLGCLLRGDTAHYDVIVNEVTRGIGQSAQETGVPHAFGVLTCDTLEQAIDRAGLKMGNKGFEAALAAVEMANLRKASVGPSSLVVGKGARTTAVSSPLSAFSKNRKSQRPTRPKKRRP
jgi:6,7-dimethyl-8-ribityllumazine synthase